MSLLTRRRAAAGVGVLALLGGMFAPSAAFAAEPVTVLDDPIALETGHIDAFNLVLNEDDSPRLVLKEDVTGSHVLRTPESVTLQVKEDAKMTVPENYLPGMPSEIYHLPLTQDANLIWPGWDTNALTPVYGKADTKFVVSAVDGPGEVFLWTQGQFGTAQSLLVDGGYTLPGSISQPYPAHTHAAWAFTEAGTYTFTVRGDITGEDGTTTASTNTATYTFVVGDQPATPTLTIEGLSGHYHQNTPIVLNAVADPAVESGVYEWFLQRKDQSEPVQIAGATGAELTLTAEQALDGARITANLVGQDDEAISAEAVTIEVDDHGAAPLQKVTVAGIEEHYHPGDTAKLTASVDPASVLDRYEWVVKKAGETEWSPLNDEHGAETSFEATEELAGAEIAARLTYDDGQVYVESDPVLVQVEDHGDHEVPETELSIATDRAADDYWVGQTAVLTAKQSTATNLTEYRWLTKLPGADDFTAVPDQSTGEYTFKPRLDNSGVQVKVQLLHDGEVHAESAAVTITAQQRPVVTTLHVAADKESYVPGDVAKLTSTQDPETSHEHYHWYVKRAGADDFVWVDQSREKDLEYPITAEDDGAQLVLRLFDETHAVIAESEPLTLTVDDGGEAPVETTLTVSGIADHYHVGDSVSLTATQQPETGEDHYHWFIKRSGSSEFAVIDGALTSQLEYTVAEGDADAQIIARLYSHDHDQLAESAPVTVKVASHEDPGTENPNDSKTDDSKTDDSKTDEPGSGDKKTVADVASGDAGGAKLATTGGPELAIPAIAGSLLIAAGAAVALRSRRRAQRGEQ